MGPLFYKQTDERPILHNYHISVLLGNHIFVNSVSNVQGHRYVKNTTFYYDSLPEIIPSGEFRLDLKSYTMINETKRYFILSQYYTTVYTKTALQW